MYGDHLPLSLEVHYESDITQHVGKAVVQIARVPDVPAQVLSHDTRTEPVHEI